MNTSIFDPRTVHDGNGLNNPWDYAKVLPSPYRDSNPHIHTGTNFSAFPNITDATDQAVLENIGLLGVSNYYHHNTNYRIFASNCLRVGVMPSFGIEILTLADESVKFNDPNNQKRFYLCGKSITRLADPVEPIGAQQTLVQIRSNDSSRMEAMWTALGAVFQEVGIEFYIPIEKVKETLSLETKQPNGLQVPVSEIVLQERHAAEVAQKILFENTDRAEERKTILERASGKEVPAGSDLNNASVTQDVIRSLFLKAGGRAYIPETFIATDAGKQLVLNLGGIPAYPILLDGSKELTDFERTPHELIEKLQAMNIHAVEFIPNRNSLGKLGEYVTALHDAGFIVTAGTEHNTKQQSSLIPRCKDGLIPEDLQQIFFEGACVITAHAALLARRLPGYVDSNGDLTIEGKESKNHHRQQFVNIGAGVLNHYINDISESRRVVAYPDSSRVVRKPTNSLAAVTEMANFWGRRPNFAIAGGGNISVKDNGVLWVKGSGKSMKDMGPNDFVKMDRAKLAEVVPTSLQKRTGRKRTAKDRERVFLKKVSEARLEPEREQRPSVEVVLHNLLQGTFVVHTHPTVVNQLTCTTQGEGICQELFGKDVLWIPYVDPGCVLADEVEKRLIEYRQTYGREPLAILLKNHGLFVDGESAADVYDKTEYVLRKIESRLKQSDISEPFGARTQEMMSEPDFALVRKNVQDATRVYSESLYFESSQSSSVEALVCSKQGKEAALGGPLTPDQIVYCKRYPLWLSKEDAESSQTVQASLEAYKKEYGYLPRVVAVEGGGIITIGVKPKEAINARDIYVDIVEVMYGAAKLTGINYMNERDALFIENWEIEAYRAAESNK